MEAMTELYAALMFSRCPVNQIQGAMEEYLRLCEAVSDFKEYRDYLLAKEVRA